MGHWYTQQGEPMHWIEGANGKQRDTTLRDARKLNLSPSVTTILGVIDKPALTNWKLKQVTKACRHSLLHEDLETYHKANMETAFQESTDARDRGSEIHDCLDSIAKTEDITAHPKDICVIAANAWDQVIEYCGTGKFTAEATVVGDGYGGMVDLHNDDICLDWKTKDITDVTKRMAYDEQAMQLAGYDRALFTSAPILDRPPSYQPRRCINVFIDRTVPGKLAIYEWKPEDISLAWEKFQLLVKYWQLAKGYKPEPDEISGKVIETLKLLLKEMKPKTACSITADIYGVKKNALYDIALSLK